MDQPEKLKVTLLGDAGVGKSALISRLKYGNFDEHYMETIGVEFVSHRVNSGLWLQFWDTSGMGRFECLAPTYVHQCAVAVVVFDLADRESFKQTTKWIRLARAESPGMVVFLVGNKSDTESRAIATVEASSKASELDTFYVETSAKSGENVAKLFDSIAKEARHIRIAAEQPREHWVQIDVSVPDDASTVGKERAEAEANPTCLPWIVVAMLDLGKRMMRFMSGPEAIVA